MSCLLSEVVAGEQRSGGGILVEEGQMNVEVRGVKVGERDEEE